MLIVARNPKYGIYFHLINELRTCIIKVTLLNF